MALTDRLQGALDVLSSIALIVASGALIWALFFRGAPAQPRIVSVQGLSIDVSKIANVSGQGPFAIVEFSDYQCPFCAKHAQETLPAIKRSLMKSGQVRYVTLHYPLEQLHPLALEASEASECAGQQGRFWEMHERLFGDPTGLTTTDLVNHARALRLDSIQFQQCLSSDEMLEKIRSHQAEGRRLGIGGTPVFFVGRVRQDGGIDLARRINGAVPVSVFAEEINELGLAGDARLKGEM